MQLFFSLMFTYPSFPQPLSWPTGAVDLQAWKNVMITLEKDNNSFAVETYKLLVPEPAGPQVCQRVIHKIRLLGQRPCCIVFGSNSSSTLPPCSLN